MTKPEAQLKPAGGTPVDRHVGRLEPERAGLRVACILEQAHYKPGDKAPDGYLAWHEWAEVQHKAGLRQVQCGKCGMWRYPQELSREKLRWTAHNSRGEAIAKVAPLCLKCHEPPNVAGNLPARQGRSS